MVALTVIALVFAFILLDIAIRNYNKVQGVVPTFFKHKAIPTADDLLSDFIIPLGFFFHPGHTWARIQDHGDILIGADDFAQKTLGSIDTIDLPTVGQKLTSNSPAFQLIQGRRRATFLTPISGTVTEVNDQLKSRPRLIKDEPYGSGWVVRITPSTPTADLKSLVIADSATQWLKKEISSLRDFLMNISGADSELGTTIADGGIPVSGVMEQFDDAAWNRFQQTFLSRTGDE
jgi:glycine cleavage system H lipoate-binding protein